MLVFLNGQFVPEEGAMVSVFDRSFRYGDGLFEAVLARNGRLFRWNEHARRLQHGADVLAIRLPYTEDALRAATERLLRENGLSDAMVRITVSRGASVTRGYAPSGSEQPTVVISCSQTPTLNAQASFRVVSCSIRAAPGDPLRQHKSASRLLNVLAAVEARNAGADEALVLDTNEHVLEGTSSNLFWVRGGSVVTAPASAGLLPGITRGVLFDLCRERRIPICEEMVTLPSLCMADGVFLSFTSRGIVAITEIDGKTIARSPVVATLASAYHRLVETECGGSAPLRQG